MRESFNLQNIKRRLNAVPYMTGFMNLTSMYDSLRSRYNLTEQEHKDIMMNVPILKEYLEKEALEKLSLTKPGQTIVIVPDTTPEDYVSTPRQALMDIPNWRKWAQLFGFSKRNSVQ